MLIRLLPIAVFAGAMSGCEGRAHVNERQRELDLVTSAQHALFQSVEAEKSAVLAATDEESTAFANESRRYSGLVEKARLELHQVFGPAAGENLEAFDDAWRKVQAIDAKLLALAVANTNLKASRLASGEAARAVNELVDSLAAVEAVTTEPPVLRELSTASVAALRIQALLAPHIAAPADAEMSALEEQMRTLGATVETALADARKRAPPSTRERAAQAWETWARYQHLTAEVIRLSRLNSNVLSVDLSVHEKLEATIAAQNALGALFIEIRDAPRATR